MPCGNFFLRWGGRDVPITPKKIKQYVIDASRLRVNRQQTLSTGCFGVVIQSYISLGDASMIWLKCGARFHHGLVFL